jgi:deoxycytidine triphosphate deaminase
MATSFLVDKLIIEAVKRGDLVIEDPGGRKLIDPTDGTPARDAGLDAHGYILHARRVCSWRKGFSAKEPWIDLKKAEKFVLRPKESVLIETYERLSLSRKICGTIHSLARLTLLGISHISTTVHPGWGTDEKGPQPLRIAICNLGHLTIEIRDKEPIARIIFHESETNAQTNAPLPEEVFQRVDNAIERHMKASADEQRNLRLSFLVILTASLLTILSILSEGISVVSVLKAIAMALLASWAAYIFREMTE